MKTYKERTTSILEKAASKRKKRNTLRALACSLVVILGLSIFMPHNTIAPAPDNSGASKNEPATQHSPIVIQPEEDEYATLVASLKEYRENLNDRYWEDEVVEDFVNESAPGGAMNDSAVPEEPSYSNGSNENSSSPTYEETTDNQVAGVIEGDHLKRSNEYIYYLRHTTLTIYSIQGLDSQMVGSYEVPDADGYRLNVYENAWEMFLSPDCKTITIIASAYHTDSNQRYVVLVSLDVSDPANIKENKRTYLTGNYITSRMVDGDFLIISNYYLNTGNIDYDDPSTFVPEYGANNEMECVDGHNIVIPDTLANTHYTVVCKINGETLEALSTAAFLSYSDKVYVSSDNVYTSRTFCNDTQKDDLLYKNTATEISAITYTGKELTYAGSIQVDGYLENQYSMDEYNGILRVATTTSTSVMQEVIEGDYTYWRWVDSEDAGTNANLYCIDLDTWKIAASVEKFAPKGETVRSVRFDKDNAYVCTAIQLMDPVFYFDLSNLSNITVKDTGTITGYSISLVNFGDYLLGIGYGSTTSTLKIELYEETPTGVASVCSYEVKYCSFATDYKAYLIDRENMRIGLGYSTRRGESDIPDCYTLLQFDGYDFFELIKEPITGFNGLKRAVIIDGYIYMFGNNFIVKEI